MSANSGPIKGPVNDRSNEAAPAAAEILLEECFKIQTCGKCGLWKSFHAT